MLACSCRPFFRGCQQCREGEVNRNHAEEERKYQVPDPERQGQTGCCPRIPSHFSKKQRGVEQKERQQRQKNRVSAVSVPVLSFPAAGSRRHQGKCAGIATLPEPHQGIPPIKPIFQQRIDPGKPSGAKPANPDLQGRQDNDEGEDQGYQALFNFLDTGSMLSVLRTSGCSVA